MPRGVGNLYEWAWRARGVGMAKGWGPALLEISGTRWSEWSGVAWWARAQERGCAGLGLGKGWVVGWRACLLEGEARGEGHALGCVKRAVAGV